MDYNNPLVEQRADPWVLNIGGYYYFTASVPEYDRIELRRAKTINGLTNTKEVKTIWQCHKSGEMSCHIWAPELHRINGEWYIYFTASDKSDKWQIRPYALKCSDKDPLSGKWEECGRIDIGAETFSLDMTVFENRGRLYAVWAQKFSETTGSVLCIAEMKDPLTLSTKPIILTVPEYDWECQGFKVNEGPAVLLRNGKVLITYSASDTGWRYCMGLLWANAGDDLLDPSSWNKSKKPVFSTSDKNRQYGPGHNCFTTDNGRDVLIYHSRSYKNITGDPLEDPNRHARAKIFDYDENGLPIFGEPTAERKISC